jgi:hypothetical protein
MKAGEKNNSNYDEHVDWMKGTGKCEREGGVCDRR